MIKRIRNGVIFALKNIPYLLFFLQIEFIYVYVVEYSQRNRVVSHEQQQCRRKHKYNAETTNEVVRQEQVGFGFLKKLVAEIVVNIKWQKTSNSEDKQSKLDNHRNVVITQIISLIILIFISQFFEKDNPVKISWYHYQWRRSQHTLVKS